MSIRKRPSQRFQGLNASLTRLRLSLAAVLVALSFNVRQRLRSILPPSSAGLPSNRLSPSSTPLPQFRKIFTSIYTHATKITLNGLITPFLRTERASTSLCIIKPMPIGTEFKLATRVVTMI